MTARYKQLADMVRFARPETIVEVGTHNGRRAKMLCAEALKYRERVHYVGYDLFDLATDETNDRELNGKGPGSEEKARSKLDAIARQAPGFSFHLVKGDTRDTLHGTEHCADFAFIDGGHSVETIAGDFAALKTSRVIALDDYYTGRMDTTEYGCNSVISDVQHVVLPQKDTGPAGTVQIAAIGYDPKWTEALEHCRKYYELDTISFWRDGGAIFSDLVVCINVIERELDLRRMMESVIDAAGKRIFFVIKEDIARPVAWWKETLAKYVFVDEWYGHSGEVCGTARPMRQIVSAKGHQAWADDKRFENVKANVAKVQKRFEYQYIEPHAGRIILVSYGPSLKDTWEAIEFEKRHRGGKIVSVSGAHDFLLERGITPDYHVECDPRPHKALNLAKGVPGVEYYIASCAHPDLIDRLSGCDVTLWHMDSTLTSVEAIKSIEPDAQFVPGGGSVSMRAWPLFYLFGYRNFSMYGLDCSFAPDAQHAGKHFGTKQHVIDVMCEDGRWFKTSAVLINYKNHFFDMWNQHMSDCLLELHGDGLLQHMCMLAQRAKEKTPETEAA